MPKRQTNDSNPEWTEADFRKAVHLRGTALEKAVKALRRGRGLQKKPKKIAISIRVHPDIIAHFKSGGAGWQSRMEKALMAASTGKKAA